MDSFCKHSLEIVIEVVIGYAYVENDDTMIAIDREQLENLVSGRFIPNVSSIIIAQPPSKPDSLPLASTSNNFITDGNNVKTAPSWSYDAEDDDEDEAFPFKSGARKGRFGVGGNTRGGNKNTGTRKVLAGLPEHLKGLLGKVAISMEKTTCIVFSRLDAENFAQKRVKTFAKATMLSLGDKLLIIFAPTGMLKR